MGCPSAGAGLFRRRARRRCSVRQAAARNAVAEGAAAAAAHRVVVGQLRLQLAYLLLQRAEVRLLCNGGMWRRQSGSGRRYIWSVVTSHRSAECTAHGQ